MATIAQARAAMQNFKKGLPLAVLRGLRKGMPIALRLAKTKYMARKDNRHPIGSYDPANEPPGPLGIRQGNLIRTLKIGAMRFDGKRIKATLEAGSQDVPYAPPHEFGATIRPRNGPYLIFPMGVPGGGYRIVRATQVVIPARPFLLPSLEDAQPAILEIVLREIRTFARVSLKGIARVG
jgi:hypothetical protein